MIHTFGPHLTIWAANCPANYRALGVAVTNGTEEEEYPYDKISCIKAEFTDDADWIEETQTNGLRTDS